MANQWIAGTLLPTTAASARTIGASLAAEFVELSLTNVHASDTVGYSIWFKDQADSLANSQKVFATAGEHSLKPGESVVFPMWPMLAAGDEIQWAASTANRIAGSLFIREVTPGSSRTHEKARYLSNSLATLHTVDSGYQVTLAWIILCNHNSTPEQVEIQAIPSAQSAGDRYKLISERTATALGPGETRMLKLHPGWTAGTQIQAKAETASQVVCQLGLYREAV